MALEFQQLLFLLWHFTTQGAFFFFLLQSLEVRATGVEFIMIVPNIVQIIVNCVVLLLVVRKETNRALCLVYLKFFVFRLLDFLA